MSFLIQVWLYRDGRVLLTNHKTRNVSEDKEEEHKFFNPHFDVQYGQCG